MELKAKLKSLLEDRAKVIADQKALYANAEAESRSLNEEEKQRYEKFDKDWEKLEEAIGQTRSLLEKEDASQRAIEQYREQAEAQGYTTNASNDGAELKYTDTFEKYFRRGAEVLTSHERTMLSKREFRGTSPQSTTVTLGGYTIPQGFFPELIKTMASYSGVLQAGRLIRTDSGNDLPMPTVNDTATTASIVTEGTQSTVADITFGQKTLNAYVLRTLAQASEELLMDSAFSIEEIIRDLFADRLGRGLNSYLTTGTGSSQPNGVVTATSAGKTALATTVFTRDEVLDLVHSIDPAYRTGDKVGFMLNDAVLAEIKKLTIGSGDDRPLWQPSIREGEPDRLEGYKYWINQHMASSIVGSAKVLLFGDFNKYAIRIVRDVAVRRLNERYADYFLVGFLGFIRVDGELLDTSAVKHLIMAA